MERHQIWWVSLIYEAQLFVIELGEKISALIMKKKFAKKSLRNKTKFHEYH